MKFSVIKRNVWNILIFFLASVFLALLLLRINSNDNKPTFIFNYAPMRIISASMEPSYLTNSFVIVSNEPIENLEIGDVIAFKADALNGSTALHRIIKITDDGITVKGDNNQYPDNQVINESSYIGKCVFHTNLFARYLTRIQNIQGLIIFFLMPLITILIFLINLKKLLKLRRVR